MPDELKAIVQRMIDAGEPEENIGKVIKGYTPPYQPRNILAEGRASAATSGAPEASSGFQDWFNNELKPVLEKVARPETISDIAALLVPDAAGVVTGARAAARAAGSGAETVGKGLEALGASKLAQRIGTYGAGYAALSGNLGKAAIAAGAPPAATAAGKVLQSGGRFLQDVGARPVAEAVAETPAELTARLTAEHRAQYHGPAAPKMQEVQAPPMGPQEAPATPQAQAPTPAPVASPAPTSPAVAAPEAAAVATAPMSTPEAFKAALNAFDTAKVAPQAAEVNNAAMLIKRGIAPDEALQKVLSNRPPAPANPAEALLKSNPGFKSEAEMNADMAARARRGQKSLMPKYGGEPAPAPQASVEPAASPKVPAGLQPYLDKVEAANPAADDPFAGLDSVKWPRVMSALQKDKPSSVLKAFGTNGPSSEQLAAYTDRMKEWNRLYRYASQMQKATQ